MFGAQHFFRDVIVLQMDYSFIYKCEDLSFDHFFLVVYQQIFLFLFGRLVQALVVGICRPVGVLSLFLLLFCSEGILFVLIYVLPQKERRKKLHKPSRPLIRLNWIGKSIILHWIVCKLAKHNLF